MTRHQKTAPNITSKVAAIAVVAGLAPGVGGADTISGPQGTLFVDDGGSGGVPVVFLHSFAGDTTHWTAQLEHLRTNRRAIRSKTIQRAIATT